MSPPKRRKQPKAKPAEIVRSVTELAARQRTRRELQSIADLAEQVGDKQLAAVARWLMGDAA